MLASTRASIIFRSIRTSSRPRIHIKLISRKATAATMSSKQLLTIFGATGNQGGSVIDVVLSHKDLKDKYSLRGITRDPSGSKAKAMADKGVEMVQAELNDVDSLKKAIKGSYGVFGVTDFWSLMDKQKEIQQGKNLFDACQAEGVKHYVFSSLPWAEKITKGVLKNVDHFDSKAEVEEFVEKNKGDMIASFVMPAMFIDAMARQVNVRDGQAALSFPFRSLDTPWALIEPRRDLGKYVLGLFEGGSSANGVKVNAVSTWSTPKEVVAALSNESNREIAFNLVPAEMFEGILKARMGEVVAKELTETMLFAGDYSYYGVGEDKNQAEHDKWLIKGADKISYPQWAKENGPFHYE